VNTPGAANPDAAVSGTVIDFVTGSGVKKVIVTARKLEGEEEPYGAISDPRAISPSRVSPRASTNSRLAEAVT